MSQNILKFTIHYKYCVKISSLYDFSFLNVAKKKKINFLETDVQ